MSYAIKKDMANNLALTPVFVKIFGKLHHATILSVPYTECLLFTVVGYVVTVTDTVCISLDDRDKSWIHTHPATFFLGCLGRFT